MVMPWHHLASFSFACSQTSLRQNTGFALNRIHTVEPSEAQWKLYIPPFIQFQKLHVATCVDEFNDSHKYTLFKM